MKTMFRPLAAAGLAILTMASAVCSATADQYDRRFAVYNNGNSRVWSVQATHVGQSGWGRDLLHESAIPSGGYLVVSPDQHQGYCRFDIQVTFENGMKQTLWGVNLCEVAVVGVSEYTVATL